MGEFFKQLFKAIKLPPRYLFPLALASGLVLFGHESFIQHLGLTDIRNDYRPWLGIVFLVTTCLSVAHAALTIGRGMTRFLRAIASALQLKPRLRRLTNDEKDILSLYITRQTRTQNLEFSNGLVIELEKAGIIHRVSDIGFDPPYLPYTIHKRAWRYLNKHPELVGLL